MKNLLTSILLSIATLLVLLLVTGCGAGRCASKGKDVRRDSTRVEIRTEYIERFVTVVVTLPQIIEKVVTRDTSSFLENDFALSAAAVDKDGYLHHSLETKPAGRPVQVVTKETVRDSVVYRDREVYIETPVEVVRPLSTFVKIEIWGFWILLVSAALYIYIKIKTH